jgi:ArsR family transcriptional regulator
MSGLVLLGKALADPTRVRVLALLREADLCVCELADSMEVSMSTLSTHLQTIRQAGLVRTSRQKKWIIYSIEPDVRPLLDQIFEFEEPAVKSDRRMERDASRLGERLGLREDGCCSVGFGGLVKSEQGVCK